jgi:hypothetical protein
VSRVVGRNPIGSEQGTASLFDLSPRLSECRSIQRVDQVTSQACALSEELTSCGRGSLVVRCESTVIALALDLLPFGDAEWEGGCFHCKVVGVIFLFGRDRKRRQRNDLKLVHRRFGASGGYLVS